MCYKEFVELLHEVCFSQSTIFWSAFIYESLEIIFLEHNLPSPAREAAQHWTDTNLASVHNFRKGEEVL